MEQGQEKSTIVLKYGKRRYDGGNEIELIRTIERQKALKQLNYLQKEHLNEVQQDLNQKAAEGQDNPIQKPAHAQHATPKTKKNRILEALLIGPMKICVGLVGILTSALAIVTFGQMKNEAMVEQSRTVLKDCFKTLKKGFFDCAAAPVRACKAAITTV